MSKTQGATSSALKNHRPSAQPQTERGRVMVTEGCCINQRESRLRLTGEGLKPCSEAVFYSGENCMSFTSQLVADSGRWQGRTVLLIKIPAVKSVDYADYTGYTFPQKPGYCLFKGIFKFTPIPFAVRSPSVCRGFISAGCDFRLYRHLSRTRLCFSLLSGLHCLSTLFA